MSPSERREANIVKHLQNGKGTVEISALEGLDPANANSHVRKIALKHGLPSPKAKNLEYKLRPTPVGYKGTTLILATRLGLILAEWRTQYDDVTMSMKLGLTKTQQQMAVHTPSKHDWTLSQMHRLATLCGVPLLEMLEDAGNRSDLGFKLSKYTRGK